MLEYSCSQCQILLSGSGLAFCPWCGQPLHRRGPAALSLDEVHSSDTGTWGILFYRRHQAPPKEPA